MNQRAALFAVLFCGFATFTNLFTQRYTNTIFFAVATLMFCASWFICQEKPRSPRQYPYRVQNKTVKIIPRDQWESPEIFDWEREEC